VSSPAVTASIEGFYRLLARVSSYSAWRHFEDLQANQWLPRADVEALRWRKLQRLLAHAVTAVPFYREMWSAAGVDPRRFSSVDDLKHLPVTTRQALLEGQQRDAFLLSRRHDYQMTHSSGTTGPRVYLPFTPADMQVKYAAYLREFYATDWRLGVPSAALHYSGHPEFGGRYTGEPDRDNYVGLRNFVFRVLHRRVLLTPYAATESGDESVVEGWYDALRRHRPFLLETMDFNVLALWQYIEERGLPRLRIPRMIVLSSLSEGLRKRLEKAFSTEVFNRFGPHEMEGVAYECHEHAGLHMAIDSVHTEFLDSRDQLVAPGELGRLVLTDLDSYVMPLIRYEIGDLGSYTTEPCACGRGFPLMHAIACRKRDVLSAPGGEPLAPGPLIRALQDDPAIRLFQIVQCGDGPIEARIVPDRTEWSEWRLQLLRTKLARLVPAEEEQIKVTVVDRVPLERNGKFSFARRV
jgi:phenylacetate-CoA ligase